MIRMSVKQLNESVLKDLYLNGEYNLGKQLYDAFPESMRLHGIDVKLKSLGTFHDDLSEFSWWYGRKINFNLELHNRIMTALEYGKANDLISYDILNFLYSGWHSVEYFMTHPEELHR